MVRDLGARHGLQTLGFETSGIQKPTVADMATAVDDMLAKYPFLALRGIRLADFKGIASHAGRDQADQHQDREARTPAWILIDQSLAANPIPQGETAGQTSQPQPRPDDRPMYAAVVHAIGRILETTAGTQPRQLAESALITEYQRISGPWTTDTLATVVDGYRSWRAQLNPACFTDRRLDRPSALIEAFTEVELHNDHACGPAKVLHRLIVEHARERSNTQ
ncbi:hypothetical protein [Nocardia sp. SC052]|uniref:hypothetical protein n=1 Tax=Nocardia sichangensis TaxID=3385975 RepID=UPI0039A3CBC2